MLKHAEMQHAAMNISATFSGMGQDFARVHSYKSNALRYTESC